MKIYVLCDMEGVAGVVDFESQTYPTGKYYEQTKRLATLEVNALVDGLRAGGATDVLVLDGHGPGGLDVELLHKEARWYLGRPIVPPYGLDESFAGVVLYGHHAMNNVPDGNLAHSWSSRTIANCWLNGELIGEIGFEIAVAAEMGVPTLLITGDRAAVEEARRYVPDIESVIVKESVNRTAAISIAPAKAREMLAEAGRRVMGRIGQFSLYRPRGPYVFRTEFLSTSLAEAAGTRPLVRRVDATTVEVEAGSLIELYRLRGGSD